MGINIGIKLMWRSEGVVYTILDYRPTYSYLIEWSIDGVIKMEWYTLNPINIMRGVDSGDIIIVNLLEPKMIVKKLKFD